MPAQHLESLAGDPLLDALIETVGALVVVVDREGRIVRFNRGAEEVTGYTEAEVVGQCYDTLFLLPEEAAEVRAVVAEVQAGDFPNRHENAWRTKDGRKRIIAWRNTALVREGRVELIIGTGVDVTELRRAEAAMEVVELVGDLLATHGPTPEVLARTIAELERRYAYTYSSIYLLDGPTSTLHLGAQIGYTVPVLTFDGTKGVIGRVLRTRERAFVRDTSQDPDYISANDVVRSEICIPLMERGEILGVLNIEADEPPLDEQDLSLLQAIADRIASAIALSRKMRQLEAQAFHDPLTGLANRALFLDRLEHALARSARTHEEVAVVFLDLDDFKNVNDGLGHSAGDELLLLVGERVRSAVREEDTVARLGGDEFAVLLESVDGSAGAEAAAERIIAALGTPLILGERSVTVGASVGIAVGTTGADDLLRDADVAMYEAKRAGKNRPVVFEPPMRDAAVARLELDRDLRTALARDEFILAYQPVVDAAGARIVGVEALARWQHPIRGLLAPDAFIGAAEESGLMIPLGRQLLVKACRQARRWDLLGLPPLELAVNLSPRQLADPRLEDDVRAALEESRLPAERLTLEITEGVLMANLERARDVLLRLRALGVRIAIDDFGTGYSSLAYLKELPLDVLKVDRSFIAGLAARPDRHEAVGETLFRLGAVLGLATVAEGVETFEQLEIVRRFGTTLVQGYLVSRPLPPDELEAFLRTWTGVGIAPAA